MSWRIKWYLKILVKYKEKGAFLANGALLMSMKRNQRRVTMTCFDKLYKPNPADSVHRRRGLSGGTY